MFTVTANETNPMIDSDAYFAEAPEFMTLAEFAKAGGKITRVRLLTERWPSGRKADISYIHGVIAPRSTTDAGIAAALTTRVSITDLPVTDDLYGKHGVKGVFIEWAKESGVFAKGLGLLDEGNWSVLY